MDGAETYSFTLKIYVLCAVYTMLIALRLYKDLRVAGIGSLRT